IRAVAASHGWSIDGIAIRELVPSEQALEAGEQYTVFHPSEVELSDTTEKILDDVDRLKPSRTWVLALSGGALLGFLAAFGLCGWQWFTLFACAPAIAAPVTAARLAATKWSTPDIYDE
ncbi:MAG TPA: hypothetical protein VFZ54_11095, partial [Burkholderiales bacterium]